MTQFGYSNKTVSYTVWSKKVGHQLSEFHNFINSPTFKVLFPGTLSSEFNIYNEDLTISKTRRYYLAKYQYSSADMYFARQCKKRKRFRCGVIIANFLLSALEKILKIGRYYLMKFFQFHLSIFSSYALYRLNRQVSASF